MSRRNWKGLQPTSLRNALELCKDFALQKHNLSVERIAERMALADHWTLYKWISTGRMPATHIRAYEQACGADYVTRWLARSADKLVIDIPAGRTAVPSDTHALQESLNTAVGQILAFYAGKCDAEAALSAIHTGMEGLAYQRANISKHGQPELDLGGDA